ncbi:ADP-ribosyltransferase [Streptomyces sp. NPDC088147]|uniref:ADP-ribosyltransferase n=1 Tax=Streptomyces sp. NPDC088147 TaxID=3365830 RepID=UPI00382B01DD
MPRSLAVTRVLLYLMFALTLLGGFGVVNSLLELGSHITPMLTLLALYAVVPGIAAVILARRLWTGGKVVWVALIALQGWLLVGSIVNLYAGSARGLSQLLLPGALLALVSAGASRAWFELPSEQRAVRPRWTLERLRREGIPSVPHVIGWRRDRGQSAAEYAGMVGLVALIIGALVLGGVGTQIANGLQTAVCTILGGDCDSDTVAGGGGESGGGGNGGGDSGGGDNGGSDSGGGDNGGGDSGGGSDGGGSDGGGGSDSGGSDGGGSDGGSDSGGSDGGGSDGGGSDGGGSDGGSDSGGSDGGGSDGGGSDGGGSDGGSSNGGSDSGGSDGGSDSGGSDGGGSDGGGSDSGGSDGGSSDGGSDSGGSDGGSDSGGSDGGGSDGGGSDGGSDSGGSDGGGSDGGGSSGGTNCNPVMAPWGIMQNCTDSDTGGSDSGGSDGGGSDGGGSDSGGSDGGSSDGGSDSGGSDGGSSNGGSDGGGSDGGSDSGGSDGGGSNGGSDGGGSDGGGSDGGGSDGGSDSGGSSGGTNCNPVMAPWGIMQNCTESNTGGSDGGGGASGGSGGSSGGKNDDNKDDDNKDDDQDEDNEDKKNDCLNGSKVAFSGPVSTGAVGDGRYTLASAAVRTRVGTGGVLVGGVSLAADPGSASAMDLVQSVSGSSLAGVDTYQDAEDRVVTALGLTDEPRPEPEPDPEPEPEPEPGPDGESCSERPDPMTALDDVPKYGSTDRKDWARKVEEIARQNPLTKDFTAEDALIVADYTGSWAEDANKYLRGQPIPGSRSNSVPKFIERMDRALDHLPPVDGTFYRGTFMPDELLEKFANGEEVEMPEYLSTSSDPAKADRAAENSKSNGRKGEKVVLEVTTDNGRNIDPLSRYQGKESEVLIPRGGKFVKTGEKTKIIGGKEYKVIEVKQVG